MVALARDYQGVTLVELLIATALLSVIALGASSIYIAGSRNLFTSQSSVVQVGTYIAFEHMTRRIALANKLEVTSAGGAPVALNVAGPQLKLRWDYKTNETPNVSATGQAGTSTNTDDTWVKYLFSGTKLYWKSAACCDPGAEGANATSADPQVQPNLTIAAGSSFTQINPNTVRIVLVTTSAGLPGAPLKTITLQRDITAHAASGN